VDEPQNVALLVVDDDKSIRTLLARVATRAGFDVDTARDGAEALEMFERKDYVIAIVDLMMPRVNGYELVQALSHRTPRPTVIVASAMLTGAAPDLDDSLVRRVLAKPFDLDMLAATLVDVAREVAARDHPPAAPILIPRADGTTLEANSVTILTGAAAQKVLDDRAVDPGAAPPIVSEPC
jgi:DNA-binding response OmpR family regulator